MELKNSSIRFGSNLLNSGTPGDSQLVTLDCMSVPERQQQNENHNQDNGAYYYRVHLAW